MGRGLLACFVWVVDIVWGLRVNGYFVCVGCVEKYGGGW